MINEITIWDEDRGDNNYALWGKIEENGDLKIIGNDIGSGVKAWWGDIDYEYWYIIDKDWKDTLLLHLLAEKFTLDNTPQPWLDTKQIPYKFGSYV